MLFSNLVVIPILSEISDDFGVSRGTSGLLASVYALVAAIGSLLVGPTIDRIGRRPVILVCLVIFAFASAMSAVAPTFWVLVASRALQGVGAAGLMSAVFAAVADYFPYNERGKAMAWVFTANTTAPIVALPISAVLADFVSWRINFAFLAVVSIISVIIILKKLPIEERKESKDGASEGYIDTLLAVVRHRPTAWGCWLTISMSLIGLSSLPFWALISTTFSACRSRCWQYLTWS